LRSHRHLQLAASCSHNPCVLIDWQSSAESANSQKWDRPNLQAGRLSTCQFTQKVFEADPTAAGLLRLLFFPL